MSDFFVDSNLGVGTSFVS